MDSHKGLDLSLGYSKSAPQTSLKSAVTAGTSDIEAKGPASVRIVYPIEWPSWIKHLVLFQVTVHTSMAPWCAAAFIPAFLQMSIAFERSIEDMTYLVGAYTLMLGVGALVWNPVADHIGRRPVMLLSLAITVIATCGVAKSTTYATIMVARIFQGFGICAPCSLGAAYVKDMYASKDQGKALGVWTLGITAGPFIGPFISGFIAQHAQWTWIIWTESMIFAILFIFELLFLPESLFNTPCYHNILGLRDIFFQIPRKSTLKKAEDELLASDFVMQEKAMNSSKQTLLCLLYPAVWLCGLAFAVPFGYISVGISSLFPTVYGGLYHFEPSEQGLLYLPMLAGSILGESATGSVSDWLAAAPHANFLALWVAKRTTATEIPELIPEMRLFLGLCGTLVSTAGLLWFGISVDMHLHWIHPALASGFAAFGVQMLTTVCFSYVIDCYPKSAKENATVINLFRVVSSFIVLFYNARMDGSIGYAWSFGIQSIVTAAFSLGGLWILILFGGRWRSSGASSAQTLKILS